MYLWNARVQLAGEGRRDRAVVPPGRDNDIVSGPKSLIGVDLEDTIYLFHARDGDALAQRGIETLTEAFDIRNDLVLDHEACRIVTPIGKVR